MGIENNKITGNGIEAIEKKGRLKKRGQVTIFIILAIVIVVGVVLIVVFKDSLFGEKIPEEFRGIYDSYSGCVEQETEIALDILGSQGGRIDTGEYFPGSDFAPFSSHLNFLGFSIPYWYYISGNNLISEQLPDKGEMEDEIEEFIEDRISDCDFSGFYSQGFYIDLGEPKANVEIFDNEVRVSVDSVVSSRKEDMSARKSSHEVVVRSKIGGFYDIAVDIYNKEKDGAFLEDYALDVLYNYAPVDGIEIQCSPKIWKTPDVVMELKDGLEANIGAIKLSGDENDYFVVNEIAETKGVGVNFFYLGDEFPSKIEITPASQTLMVAEPVGNQEGLGIMGFCYVPYHFVYDLSFPVLVQVSDGQEIFQYPVSVIIDNNLPREADLSEIEEVQEEYDVCSFNEGSATINTYDINLNPVSADISYNCFDSLCELGKTELSEGDYELDTAIPICVNGYLIADAEGYAEKKILFSSNTESFADIILDREYEVNVGINFAGNEIGNERETAIVHFAGEDGTVSAILPSSEGIILKEGLYDVSVYVYGNSNIVIPATRKRECFNTARGGILGIFGGTKEECVDVEIPEYKIENALSGGGKTTTYILESDLEKGKIMIDASELPTPNSMEQLQYNYEVFDTLGVQLEYG
ncbi:MAG: hypothetical protein Q8P57_00705 [Candidatus Pacearchaeota archaeon]|nr:hypothetical protein [Candidatus Pacearchaeota archaeon]